MGMSNSKVLRLVDEKDNQYPREMRFWKKQLWGLVKVECQLSVRGYGSDTVGSGQRAGCGGELVCERYEHKGERRWRRLLIERWAGRLEYNNKKKC